MTGELEISTNIRIVSFRVVSLIAIVPDRECSTPIFIGSWAVVAALMAQMCVKRVVKIARCIENL